MSNYFDPEDEDLDLIDNPEDFMYDDDDEPWYDDDFWWDDDD